MRLRIEFPFSERACSAECPWPTLPILPPLALIAAGAESLLALAGTAVAFAVTGIAFLLWRGHSEPADYCECNQPRPAPQSGYDSLGSCP